MAPVKDEASATALSSVPSIHFLSGIRMPLSNDSPRVLKKVWSFAFLDSSSQLSLEWRDIRAVLKKFMDWSIFSPVHAAAFEAVSEILFIPSVNRLPMRLKRPSTSPVVRPKVLASLSASASRSSSNEDLSFFWSLIFSAESVAPCSAHAWEPA